VLLLTLVLYLPAIAVDALLGWLLRRSALPLRAKHLFFVAISVLLLTPVPTPAATLYVMLVPSWLVFTSNDPAWYLQFWRFGAVAGVATAFVCWLLAPLFLGEIRQRATRISQLLHMVVVGAASTVVILLLIYARAPAARGPLLTTADMTYTNSCHNTLRGGRKRISAQVRMYLSVGDDEWSKLTDVFRAFADDYGLAFRDSSEFRPGVVSTLYLSVCDEAVTIGTSEQRWASREPEVADRRVYIGVYEVEAGSQWETLAGALIARLEEEWPSQLAFRDGGGHIVPKPRELQ
jgi:hypothetical protein